MLEALCGNKNVQNVLLFLFVNGKCYGTQLHRVLNAPLTPLQKALSRLEKGGLITSYYEGKTRVYQFNSAYPLIDELEALLKKAYTLLPSQEKKKFYALKEVVSAPFSLEENKTQVLLSCWKKMQEVSQLKFSAKTHSKHGGWDGKGEGEVFVTKEGGVLLFSEKGVWGNGANQKTAFSNTFRWTLDRDHCVISLEHLRRGKDHPVFLFHLAPVSTDSLISVDSHLCNEDAYFGQIRFEKSIFRLDWRVIGPRKNEEINYYYS